MYLAFATDVIGFPLSFKESAKVLSDTGFEGFWFHIERDSAVPAAETRDLLARYRLRPAGCNLPVDFRNAEDTFRSGLAALKEYARYAKDIGIERTMTWLVPGSDTLEYKDNFALHRTRLAEIAALLEDYGISLGLEFVGPFTKRKDRKFEFIHTLDGALELIDAVKAPNVGLLLDVWHWDMAGQTKADFAKLQSERQIILVHLNDAPEGIPPEKQIDLERRLPGDTGVLRIGEFFDALLALKYSGPAVVEPFYGPLKAMPFAEAAKQVYNAAKKVWKS